MLIRSAEQDIERVLYTEKAIAARVEEIGTELTKKLGDKRPVLVCVLKGASFFYIDLCRCMNCPIDMDFIAVSSYGLNDKSTGVVRLIKDLDNNIPGRHVIIVEDILDSGITLSYLTKYLQNRKPSSICIATLLDKPARRRADVQAKYVGFTVPDAFVVGYGLDYAEKYRNLPFIGVLKPEVYEK